MATTSTKAATSDSDAGLLDRSCFDLMLIELVSMTRRLVEQLDDKGHEPFTRPALPSEADHEEPRDLVFSRLEAMGHRVGLGFAERQTATLPRPSATDALDTIKYICKDLWPAIFRKQVDNLKTNHRGVFVLTDNRFELLRRASCAASVSTAELARRAAPFLYLPAGIVGGALAGMGLDASVVAEIAPTGVPSVLFTIRVRGLR